MSTPLIVILGAGASRGSADYESNPLRPPLTVDLFDEDLYGEQLRRYDLAHQAGRYIAQERELDGALGLEQALHALRESQFAHHRLWAKAVPPYLQELLHAVSQAHYADALRYDRLIERLLRLDFVCFITLNYDLLLDLRLNAHHRLRSFDDYIVSDKNWWLIKPHGSVNWFHPSSGDFDPTAPHSDLRWDEEDFQCVEPTSSLAGIRGTHESDESKRYPALAIPEGPEDRLVLPQKHAMFVRERLRSEPEIDLLVIGYSGLDTQVLALLLQTEPKVRRLTIVDHGIAEAIAARERFHEAGFNWVWEEAWDGDFATWADGGGLTRLVDEYDGPYSD
jgi:hypothetical protein